MIEGSCCCGAVKFELARAPDMMGTCHCTRCRKTGASTFVTIAKDAFRLVQGADAIDSYAPEPGYKYVRNFCGTCGTSLGEILTQENNVLLPANCLDGDPGVRNRFHEFVAEKPDWYEICDDAKQFEMHPQKS